MTDPEGVEDPGAAIVHLEGNAETDHPHGGRQQLGHLLADLADVGGLFHQAVALLEEIVHESCPSAVSLKFYTQLGSRASGLQPESRGNKKGAPEDPFSES